MESQSVTPNADYTTELRFGVVMYGGVSLAIYINGVTNELYEMACATPRTGFALDPTGESGTREIYRRLAFLAGNRPLREAYSRRLAERSQAEPVADVWDPSMVSGYSQTRLVVDVISGTSAGGINGMFLAKALANGEQFAALKDLWVNEGDIGLLLNDKRSYTSTVPPLDDRSDKPTSLLNSDRMYAKLRAAMAAMKPMAVARPPDGAGKSPLVDELDLFVTTTDIDGAPVPLRLFDKVVYERRHKQNYRFSYPRGVTPGGNDFTMDNNPFLAFAARCTSSFPFAFEPMTLAAVTRLKAADDPPGVLRWNAFFPNLPRDEVAAAAHVHRAFGDGGYLDNKPFTYVVDMLSQRFSSVPIERKLIYIEPSPKALDPHQRPDPLHSPDALSNSIAALTSIPQYETIREDLQAVLQRNRRIERVERIVRAGEADIERQRDPFAGVLKVDGGIPPWSSRKLSDMVRFYGIAFLPYQRLRVYSVTDTLADRLGERWGIDRDSDYQYALRALVRVWREQHFNDEGIDGRGTLNAFLDQFDFDYRLRRVGFVLRKIDQLTRMFRLRRQSPITNAQASLSESDLQMAQTLTAPCDLLSPRLSVEQIDASLFALTSLKAGLFEVRSALLQVRSESGETSDAQKADYAALHVELVQVLLLLLGQKRAEGAPLALSRGVDDKVPVRLNDEMLRGASASRTLQESVVIRARALLNAAGETEATTLQKALEESLMQMRVKGAASAGAAADLPINRIAGRAWALLGKPKLTLLAAEVGDKVGVEVGNSESDTGDATWNQSAAAALNSATGKTLRMLLSEYYLRFDSFDQMSFPLYYDTGTGEPSTVEVVRISPVDATALIDEATDVMHRHKLAGTALANFGAFLDRRWRLNDIMWGRLDGVERLIQALLPMADDDTVAVRGELIALSHRRILREALVPQGHQDIANLLCKALEEMPNGGSADVRLANLLSDLKVGDGPARDRLSGVLDSLLSEQGLVEYVRDKRTVDPEPDPKSTLDSAARAVTITGRVLEGISTQRGGTALVPRWVARMGLLLQGIVAVSLPGSLKHRWWSHGVKVLYAFEVVALVFALLFGSADMRTLVITSIGVTLAVHLLTLLTGDLMRDRKLWVKAIIVGLLSGLFALAVVGARALWHVPMTTLL